MTTDVQATYREFGGGAGHVLSYEADFFAEGEEGYVHRVSRYDGTAYSTLAIKRLKDSTDEHHARLAGLVGFLKNRDLNTMELACVPHKLLENTSSGELALLMRLAPGSDLATSPELPNPSTLDARLSAAYHLARAVRRLHDNNVLIGDLATDNLVLDRENWAIYLIDVDRVGFDNEHPVAIFNDAKGEVAAPEHRSGVAFTEAMDRWSLAVLVHFLLTGSYPMALFDLLQRYADPKLEGIWPPPSDPRAAGHLSDVQLCGGPCANLFRLAFGIGRLEQPSERPTARVWEQTLDDARRHVYECYCRRGEYFVPLTDSGGILPACENCGRTIVSRP